MGGRCRFSSTSGGGSVGVTNPEIVPKSLVASRNTVPGVAGDRPGGSAGAKNRHVAGGRGGSLVMIMRRPPSLEAPNRGGRAAEPNGCQTDKSRSADPAGQIAARGPRGTARPIVMHHRYPKRSTRRGSVPRRGGPGGACPVDAGLHPGGGHRGAVRGQDSAPDRDDRDGARRRRATCSSPARTTARRTSPRTGLPPAGADVVTSTGEPRPVRGEVLAGGGPDLGAVVRAGFDDRAADLALDGAATRTSRVS